MTRSFQFFADSIREVLGVSDQLKLLLGISFGYPGKESPVNNYQMGRAPLNESITFHS